MAATSLSRIHYSVERVARHFPKFVVVPCIEVRCAVGLGSVETVHRLSGREIPEGMEDRETGDPNSPGLGSSGTRYRRWVVLCLAL
jgi:hypothetical protein